MSQFVPQMIEWYRQGKLYVLTSFCSRYCADLCAKSPIEKLAKMYPVSGACTRGSTPAQAHDRQSDDFEKALSDMHTGATIKPILLW